MSCEFCKRADFDSFSPVVDGNYATVYLAGGYSRFPKEKQFNFCPVCGKNLRLTDDDNNKCPLISFFGEMRNLTEEEIASYEKMVDNLFESIGINILDLYENKPTTL